MIRRPPRSTPLYSSAASDVYKRQVAQQSIRTAHNHLAITLVELGYSAAHILHAELGLSTLDDLLVALTCGPDMNVEDVDICLHPHVILGENGLFCRVQAAHTVAVRTTHGFITGTHALDEDHGFRLLRLLLLLAHGG